MKYFINILGFTFLLFLCHIQDSNATSRGVADIFEIYERSYISNWVKNVNLPIVEKAALRKEILKSGGKVGLSELLDEFPKLQKYVNKLDPKVDERFINALLDFKNYEYQVLDEFSEATLNILKKDIVSNAEIGDELVKFFKRIPDGKGIKAWETLADAGATTMRVDINWLNRVDGWFTSGYPVNKVKKALQEISNNAALKTAFESNEVVFDAWKWVDDGIPSLAQGQPSTYINYLKKKTIYLNQASQTSGTIKYYRVQQAGTTGPEKIVFLDANGNVTFGSSSSDWLNFSTDNIDHARYFKDIDPANRYIVEFEMPKSFDNAMKKDAIPQWGATNNTKYLDGLAPQIADPNQPGHPFTTRQWSGYWKSEFQQNVIPGSGKIVP